MNGGVYCTDEGKLYEYFILETFQAGLSWQCILNKREAFRQAYDDFKLEKVCDYDEAKIDSMMQNQSIIRNHAKIKASINNSRIYQAIVLECGSFQKYLNQFTEGKIIIESDGSVTTSPLSNTIANDLRNRGMRFVGSTTIYAFLQAVGIVNAYSAECFRYDQLKESKLSNAIVKQSNIKIINKKQEITNR